MIDFHTHFFPDSIAQKTMSKLTAYHNTVAYTDGTENGLKASMKEAGIDLSIILPVVTSPEQFKSINQFAEQYRSDTLLSFGGIHPDSANYKEELKELHDRGFIGIKLHPDYQGVLFNDIRYKRLVSYANELGMIIMVHAGWDVAYPDCIHCTPRMASEVIDEVAPQKLILAHLGGFFCWDDVEKYIVGKDVYLDTSLVFKLIADEQFVRICRNHGVNKILFGTDSPWTLQKDSVDYLNSLDLTASEKQQILEENARNVLT